MVYGVKCVNVLDSTSKQKLKFCTEGYEWFREGENQAELEDTGLWHVFFLPAMFRKKYSWAWQLPVIPALTKLNRSIGTS